VVQELYDDCAAEPFKDVKLVTNSNTLLTYLRGSAAHRPLRPALCPVQLWEDVIFPCWNENPEARPTWEELVSRLERYKRMVESTAP
jgi:hypothetical protein